MTDIINFLGRIDMKASFSKIISVKLSLSYEEACWLRNVMQNKLHSGAESDEDKIMRERFFYVLNDSNLNDYSEE